MTRLATEADLARVAEIHIVGWRYAYRGIVSDRELFADRTVVPCWERWKETWAQSPEGLLVYDDGIVKGFCFQGGCRDQDAPGAHEVWAIYAEPAFVREGVGTALLTAAERAATAQGRSEMKLWVLEGNPRGRSFYEKHGYRPDGTTQILEDWGNARELRYAKALG